jgi:hypothetical protein
MKRGLVAVLGALMVALVASLASLRWRALS